MSRLVPMVQPLTGFESSIDSQKSGSKAMCAASPDMV